MDDVTGSLPLPPSLERAVHTIVTLGIAAREDLEPHVAAWLARPPSEASGDDEDEVAGLFGRLLEAGVLVPAQYQTLLSFLGADAIVPAEDPFVGRRLGGYLLETKIGEGATARVYRARRGAEPANLVVKVFARADDEDGLARFVREGEIMAAVDHPNVVRVVEAARSGNQPFMVMELVDGLTLQQIVERRKRLPWETATKVIWQLASALTAVHALGVVHRDIKPHNVLVSRAGVVKLSDFGIAKMLGRSLTAEAGQILGSPAFIAPEQWGDHAIDHRADLFALGVVYYLLLTGVTPFRGRTPADYATRIKSGQYTPLSGFRSDVPARVRHVVHQLLERDRRHRTPSAHALLADVQRCLKGEEPDVPRLETRIPEPGSAEPDTAEPDTAEPDTDANSAEAGLFPLVGADAFLVGTGSSADLRLGRGQGGSPSQAVLERTAAGLLLRVLDPSGVTEVNGQRIRNEVVLKDGDEVTFSRDAIFTYREGNVGRSAPAGVHAGAEDALALDAPPTPPRVVPALLIAALEEAAHSSVILGCLEGLDETTAEEALARSERALSAAAVPPEVQERALQRASRLWGQRRTWLADRLFHTTHENLGQDTAAWLRWWFEVRTRFPLQVRPPVARVQGRLLITLPRGERLEVDLRDAESWSLGRSKDADIQLSDLSVSRLHVRIDRLLGRFAFRDLGSRQGVRRGGRRHEIGFLQPGELLETGRVRWCLALTRIRPAAEQAEVGPPGERYGVDRPTFVALVDMRAPCVTDALIEHLDTPGLIGRCQRAAAAVGLERIEELIEPFLEGHRALALEALPAITGKNFGNDVAAWRAWRERQDLPPQIEPAGWLGPSLAPQG